MKRSNNGIGLAATLLVAFIIALMALVALSGCAQWDGAVIAVDDIITELERQDAGNQAEPVTDPVPDEPAQPVPPATQEPETKPDPECGVPALPGQKTIERMAALWKPTSESDGKLVTLLDRRGRTHVVKAEIMFQGIVYEQARFVGDDHNGCRPHHRWKFPGSRYASGCVLLYTIDGEGGQWLVSYYVGDSSRRIEWGAPTGIISPDGRIIRK